MKGQGWVRVRNWERRDRPGLADGRQRLQIECFVPTAPFDTRLGDSAISKNSETDDDASGDLRLLHPAGLNALLNELEVLGATEVGHISRQSRSSAAAGRQTKASSPRARFGDSSSRPDF